MKAWYFSNKNGKLRYGDGRSISSGLTHTIKGTPELCSHGLHASERIIDALSYAPDTYVWFVNVSHKVAIGKDKICGQRRKYYWGFNAENVLRVFARKQALINIEKAKPYFKSVHDYDLTIEFLTSGAESLRQSAEAAAEASAWSAAEAAAWSAEAAARSAEAAAWSAEAAARSAEAAARSAVWSARSAAWSARSAANEMLESLIIEEAKRLKLIK